MPTASCSATLWLSLKENKMVDNLKNWRWWALAAPVYLVIILVLSIPKIVLVVLRFMVGAVEKVDFGSHKTPDTFKKLFARIDSWVDRGVKKNGSRQL